MAIKSTDFSKTSHKGLKLHRDGVTFLLDITVSGERYRKKFNSDANLSNGARLETAYDALNVFRDGIIKSLTIEADLNASVDAYWQLLKNVKDWKPDHERAMSHYYDKNIKSHLGSMKVSEVRPRHLTAFNVTLKHLSSRYQKKAYEILKPLFDLALEDEIITTSPIKKIHVPVRNQLSEKKIITDASVKLRYLYQTLISMFKDNPHHLALFLFGFYGRRLGETVSLQWEDINFIDDTYLVRRENSKVNVEMLFKLPDDIRTLLMDIRPLEHKPKGAIFSIKYLNHLYPEIRKQSALPDFSYHWMRNLIVSALASEGVDATHLASMLGHQDASTLKKYLTLQRQASTAITNDITTKLLSFE